MSLPQSRPKTETKKAFAIGKEYEDFAYIVSHDLSAPLRHIREFTRLLLDSRAKPLTEDEREYSDILESSIERLRSMQEALLAFSRISTKAGEMRPVDCNSLIARFLKSRADDITAQKSVMEISPLPIVRGEPELLYILFFHVLDNALKFHEEGQAPLISITATQRDQDCLFKITDNGLGIAPEYREEVFKFFRRLNLNRFPGIGAGLPITRKIVRQHLGEIWIESDPDNRTTVCFTLPIN